MFNFKKYGKIKNKYGICEYGIECDYAHIFNLYIYPKYRNQGKAKDIILKAINALRIIGYNDKIQIVSNPHDSFVDKNKLSIFYESLGLEVFEYYG